MHPSRPQTRLPRRTVLALTGGIVAGLAGCVSAPRTTDDRTRTPEASGGVATDLGGGIDLPVDESELRRGASRDAIPAVVDPAFGKDWSDVSVEVPWREFVGETSRTRTIEPRLGDDDHVIGVIRDGEARAYPFRVLNWHEIVNDTFDEPVLVSYCPLCRTAVTTDRRVDGTVTNFGVSGLLYKNALVMYDEVTDSLWSQVLARAIRGPQTGESLALEPTTITTWGEWRDNHPDTVVLRPPPESGTIAPGDGTRNYNVNPYVGYQQSDEAGLDGEFDDDRLHPKTEVLGVSHGDVARAYPAETIAQEDPLEDEVDGLPIVVTMTGDGTPIAWVRAVDVDVLSFAVADRRHLRAGGSTWNRATGLAVDGPHEGTRLTQANAVSALFWFAWLDFYPDTEVYGEANG